MSTNARQHELRIRESNVVTAAISVWAARKALDASSLDPTPAINYNLAVERLNAATQTLVENHGSVLFARVA